MVISSKANPLIKKITSLSERKFRKELGEFIVEGIKCVNECLTTDLEIVTTVCTEKLAVDFPSSVVVSEELFSRISSDKSPQGVLAVVKLPSTAVRSAQGDCILLDRVRDPGNLGTIIRTANAAGYRDIYLVGCADPYSPKVVRASMGGIFYVNICEGSYEEVFTALKGFKIVTADMSGENVFDFRPEGNFCLTVGNEGAGIGDEVAQHSDYTVKIPMRETCESLNAAVSAAIAMYALKNNRS